MNVLEYTIAFMLLSTAFYLLYRFRFSKSAYFEFNRWYLLCALPLSALIPLIDFSVESYVPQTILLETFYLDTIQPTYHKMIGETKSFEFVWLFYGLGCLFMLGYTLMSIFKMFRIRKVALKKTSPSGDYYQHKSIQKAFSFFRWVFVNESEEHVQIVCKHEYVHVRNWHSVDKFVLQLFRIVFWFHPIWKFYEKSMDETHEYIVDKEISDSIDKNTYVNILLGQLMGVSGFPLTSGFSDKSILKRRIMMMNQSKKGSWRTYLLLIPVLMTMLVTVSCTKGTDNLPEVKDQTDQAKLEGKTLKANQVDEFPMTENCQEADKKNCFRTAIMNHLTSELTYPEAVKELGVNERFYISFVIDKTGKITDVEVERGGENELLRAEALRVVRTIPQFIPAKKDGKAVAMQFAVPIVFKI